MTLTARRKIVSVNVTDAEKRRYPSKHYVYVIQVKWDDGSNTVVFRRYSKFFDFQIALLESFPVEGGLKDPSKRTIPFLPGKILFRRSHVRDVAMKRLKPIDEYCSELVRLPSRISESDQVLDFFESKPEDLNPPTEETNRRKKRDEQDIGEISGPILLEQYAVIADYTRVQSKELTVTTGQLVDVIEKHENGWWFVSDEEGERGWVPGVYLEKQDGTSENLVTKQLELGYGEKYITTAQFNGGTDEVSFGSGVLVEVLQKNLEGWWYISYQGKQGWAPASYLEKPADAVLRQSNKVEVISSLSELRDHRRSLPVESSNLVIPVPSNLPQPSASSPKRHLSLSKTNSNPSSSQTTKRISTVASPKPAKVLPPPKRSSVKKSPVVSKPQIPPPLPPSESTPQEPIYEYYTSSPFNADIPHSISFQQDKKVKVLEKSPGDWWYIALDGEEGWAPASHIKKEFVQKKTLVPPGRPKPPSVVRKPSQPEKKEPVLYNNIGKSQNEGENQQHKSAPKSFSKSTASGQRPLPIFPLQMKSKEGDGEPAGSHPNQLHEKPSVTKPKLPLKTQKNFANKVEVNTAIASVDFRSVLKPAVASKTREATGQPALPSKPASKPDVVPNKAKPIVPNTLKQPETKTFTAKQQTRTPPPVPSSKKPAVPKKDNAVKPVPANNFSVSTESKQVDFRSVLKSSKNTVNHDASVKAFDGRTKKPPVLPAKPLVTAKPAAKVRVASRCSSNVTASATSPATKTFSHDSSALRNGNAGKRPMLPNSKPVLRRFQVDRNLSNRNDNNNSETQQPAKSEFIVNRVEADFIVPSTPLPFTLRGCPDGEVDSTASDDCTKKKDLSPLNLAKTSVVAEEKSPVRCEAKYVAVASFVPEDSKEMGFAKGDIAMLLEVAKNDWWYVRIDSNCGWVPCSYFQPMLSFVEEREQAASPNVYGDDDFEQTESAPPEVVEEPLDDDGVYSEITEEFHEGNDSVNLYRAGTEFSATDASTIDLAVGDMLEVLDRTDTGWWYVKVHASLTSEEGTEGWVPSEYLDKL